MNSNNTINNATSLVDSRVPTMYLDNNRKEVDVNIGKENTEDEGMVFIIQGKIAVQAVEDKILVLLDKFKTGYECVTCDGTGILQKCSTCGGTGVDRFEQLCKECNGTLQYPRDCWKCKGVGASIIVPETTKQIPTSGVIVSCGPKCEKRKLGERVLFGAHTGYYLPFKGNVRLRLLREHEIMCLMHKIDPSVTMEDFQLLQEPIDNSGTVR
jgi:co-chaperonin GroES (HSP10)